MELAIYSAKVFTADRSRPYAEAVLIKDGRFAVVGDNAAVKAAASAEARTLDLAGRLVAPGLVDAHLHFLSFGRTLSRVDLRGLTSIAACREKVAEAAGQLPPGKWILGWGWNHHLWSEGRGPAAADLDDLTPQNPVLLHRMCGHSVWVNTEAMRIAGLDSETVNPPGTEVVRDESGRPTGWIKEWDEVIECKLPEETLDELKDFAEAAQAEAIRRGVTGVHSLENLDSFKALAALNDDGKLKIRVHHSLPPDQVDRAVAEGLAKTDDDRLWFSQVKTFTDGSLGSGTALMHEEYSDEPGQLGIEFNTPEALLDHVTTAYQNGLDVAIHAIGDKALTNAIDALAKGREQFPGDHRDRIEHLQLFKDADLRRLVDMKIIASVQPVHIMTDWSVAERRWGPERSVNAYALKSLADAGLRLQMGSDAPVEPIDPKLSLIAAVTRQDMAGQPEGGWRPEQRLSLEEALADFSAPAAFASRREDRLGTISVGKLADLTVFEKDLFDVPPSDWLEVDVEMTVIGGEIVYQKA
jgi:hypothetical protein